MELGSSDQKRLRVSSALLAMRVYILGEERPGVVMGCRISQTGYT
jgi:hypothetical protein